MTASRSAESSELEIGRRGIPAGRMRDWHALAPGAAAWHWLVPRSPWIWPYGGLTLLLGLAMWSAWSSPEALIVGGDAVLIHYPWFVLWRDALAAGEFPFWNPYTFSGLPAFPTLQAGYGYPLHWAFTWAPAISAMNWMVGLHVLLAGLGAAWCAGRLGASKDGQVLSGVAYALGSAMVARMWAGHLSFVESNAWLPLATGLAIGVQRRYAVVYLALAVAMMTLGGQPELLIFSLWWLPLWAGLAALKRGLREVFPALIRVVLGVGFGVGLAAFQLLPVVEMLSVSNRQADMSWDFKTGASLPPWHLLEVVAPVVFGDPRNSYWPGPGYEWHERLLYVGMVPLFAAGWVAARWRWLCWSGAAVALALAFGRYVPWYAWIQVLPGYESFRIPSKHLVLAALALALAAGSGLDRLSGRRVSVAAFALAVLLAVAAFSMAQWLPISAQLLGGADLLGRSETRVSVIANAPSALLPAIVLLLLVGILALWPSIWARRGILLLATLELWLVLQPFRGQRGNPEDIVANVGALRDFPKAVMVGGGGALVANFGPVLRVQQPVGYVSIFSAEYMTLLSGSANAGVAMDISDGDDPILRLLGYGVVVDRGKRLVTVAEPPPPQAWVARCVWPGTARDVREPDFPRDACITRATATEREPVVPPGPARIVAERAGWLALEAEGPGWLVTTQPWYPGWSGWIDGTAVPVEAVDGALVGLSLPPGTHSVTLAYRPAGLERGLLISSAAGVMLLAIGWSCRGRSMPSSRLLSALRK